MFETLSVEMAGSLFFLFLGLLSFVVLSGVFFLVNDREHA